MFDRAPNLLGGLMMRLLLCQCLYLFLIYEILNFAFACILFPCTCSVWPDSAAAASAVALGLYHCLLTAVRDGDGGVRCNVQ